MACPDSSRKTGLVAPISSKLVAAKRDENWGQTVEKQKSRIQFDGGHWEQIFKKSILLLKPGLLKGPGMFPGSIRIGPCIKLWAPHG